MDTHTVLDTFHHHLTALERLLEDVPDKRMAEQHGGVRNHPAWTVPHLCLGIQFGLAMLGRDGFCPDDWKATCGMGSEPVTDRATYAHASIAMEHCRRGHDLLTIAMKETHPTTFAKKNPIAPARSYFPTVGHGILYITTVHDAHHQAQLGIWKRAAGLMKD